MLGVGLHSYGFMDTAAFWLLVFVVSQLALIAIGSLPPKYWKSLANQETATAPATAPKPAV